MADAYVLSEADVRTLRRMAQRERGDPVNHRPPVQGPSHPGKLPVVRLGIAYGTLPAAQYDGGGALVQPGKGECKMHRLRADGSGVIDLDDLPTPAYSIMPYQVADGKELLLLRDQTLEGDDENVSEPGYLALQLHPAPAPPPACFAFSDGYHSVGSDTVNWSRVPLAVAANYAPDVFEFDEAGDAIHLKQVGTYEVFYELFAAMPTSGGLNKEDRAEFEVQDRNGAGLLGTHTSVQSIGHAAGTSGDNVRRTGRVRIESVQIAQYVQLWSRAVLYDQGIQVESVQLGVYYLGELAAPSAT